jgi:hypothetical protein
MVETHKKFSARKERGEKNMKKRNLGFLCVTLMMIGIITIGEHAAAENTKLFVTLDTKWDHAHAGDTFIVRADVKNIGQYPALLIWIHLKNIPNDWNILPGQQLILLLQPGQTKPKFFAVERGPTDATIYSTAQAYNAPLVSSNRIAIPINAWILAALAVACGVMLYRETTLLRKQEKNKQGTVVPIGKKFWR